MITEMPLTGNSSQILFQTSLFQAFPEDRRTETLLAGKELTCEREKRKRRRREGVSVFFSVKMDPS